MKQSQLATKVRKEVPDETSKNAKILIQAGYITKTMSGVYSFLPLGLRTLNKIIGIIREEMNGIGGQEISFSSLQSKEVWEKSGRWDSAGEVWFKSHLNAGGDVGFGWTHEEAVSEAMKHQINSHRDIPKYIYQFQTKFRNELRAKSGIMRTREFIMKDLYSFSKDEEEHKKFYELCADAYMRIFEKAGIGDKTYRTFASGGDFSEFSDEFQTITSVGEDVIYISEEKNIAINKEIYNDDVLSKLGLDKNELREEKSVEVGNIFTLGTRFSEAADLKFKDDTGKEIYPFMGSYGIGPARLLGIIIEMSDEFILSENIAPYRVHLIEIGKDASGIYEELSKVTDVLYDDRDVSAGEKFGDSDLLGIPNRMIVSDKNGDMIEYSNRATGEVKQITKEELLKMYA